MQKIAVVLSLVLLAGCSGSPPKPPSVEGDYRPINKTTPAPKTDKTFNFQFEGDIVKALEALHEAQPQLKVMPPVGLAVPLPVRVSLYGTTLEGALRAIGSQGAGIADVIWNTTPQKGVNEALIRFRAPYQPPSETRAANTQ